MGHRQKRLAAVIGQFMPKYGRQSQAGREPNDRRYDHRVERRMKRMDPVELDELINGAGEFDDGARDAR
ncbi:MAG: hypothetical protein PGN13_09625 [Patulibacter minatonensis]